VSDFAVLQYAAGGMDAQRSALDVLAGNVAMTETADPKHPVHPMQPQFAIAGGDEDESDGDATEFAAALGTSVSFASYSPSADGDGTSAGSDAGMDGGSDLDDDPAMLPGQVAFAGARPSARAVTGVDAVSEMVAVLGAQRAYEANASVFDTGKRLIQQTLRVEDST
jgi:flagellar basal body rod protein FlgC